MTLSRLMTFTTTTTTDGRPVTTFYTQVVTVTLMDYNQCGTMGPQSWPCSCASTSSNHVFGANCGDFTQPSTTAIDLVFDDDSGRWVRQSACLPLCPFQLCVCPFGCECGGLVYRSGDALPHT